MNILSVIYGSKMFLSIILLVVTEILSSNQATKAEFRTANEVNRVCYYVPDKTISPKLLDASLCTHIIVGFGAVRNGILQPSNPSDVQIYQQINELKTENPSLKTLISIGGGGSTGGFPDTVRNATTRMNFIKQSLQFLKKFEFDGLDIDWEFPAWNGAPAEDKQTFTTFLKEFHDISTQTEPKMLTAAVASVLPIIDISYDIPQMAKYVDFVSIMCYDYHFYRKFFPFTGHNGPLFKHHDDIVYLNTLNTAWSAERWETAGMPKSKIMVGFPTYGHTFELLQAEKNQLYAATVGPGSGDGWITYPQVCDLLKSGGTRVFDNESMVPYAYKDLNWVSYDDVQSMTIKAKWILKMGYGGAMTWNINSDDWSGACDDGHTKFPLHNALRENLQNKN